MKKLLSNIRQVATNDDVKWWVRAILISSIVLFGAFVFLNRYTTIKTPPVIAKMSPPSTYKDKHGEMRSELAASVVSKEEFQRVTDSFKEVLKGRVAINTVTQYVPKIETTFVDKPIYIDTNGNFLYSHKDNYISLSAYGNMISKKGNFHLMGVDTVTYIDYTRKHFLKSNERIINISNRSPYTSIIEGNSISLRERKTIFTIGPYIGYDVTNNKVGVGVALTLNLIPIKTRK